MRKIITTTFVTLDGVMQAPGGPDEDTSGGFKYGGWQAGVPMDDTMNTRLYAMIGSSYELLLGKTTYDIWASFWPHQKGAIADPFNKTIKHVVSDVAFEPAWKNSVCITGDVVEQLKDLKKEDGPDLWVWGSGNLIQTLLKHDLIDRMHVWIYPITLGSGKKLFADGTHAQKFDLVASEVSSTGIILATYEPVEGFKTGRVDG